MGDRPHPCLIPSVVTGEFWLGLEKVHCILGDRGSHLAVQLQDWEGNSESLEFSIRLGGEDTAYSLRLTAPVAGELGVATAGIPENSSLPFSTWDQDHDLRGDLNCAKTLSGELAPPPYPFDPILYPTWVSPASPAWPQFSYL